MATVQVFWDDAAKSRLVMRVSGTVTWNTLERALADVSAQLNSVRHSVQFVTVYTTDYRTPAGSAFPYLKRLYAALPAHVSCQVLVSARLMDRILLQTYMHLYRHPCGTPVCVRTLDDARLLGSETRAERAQVLPRRPEQQSA